MSPELHLVNPQGSRAVLIGTPTHTRADDRLPDVPAVAHNVADLVAVLTDPDLGGLSPKHCVSTPPDAGLADVGDVLGVAAEEASDLLLIYYSGHGLLDRRGQLHLALAATHPDRLPFTALPYEALRSACLDSDARMKVVILDSCFSGRAIGQVLTAEDQEILGQLDADGTYTLTSAPANRTALVLPGERNTAFTGRLLALLRGGDPSAGPVLTMGEIYRHLRIRAQTENLPLPQQRGTSTADRFGLVRNRRPATVPLPEEVRETLESRVPDIRIGGVNALGKMLASQDAAISRAAHAALREVVDRDNPRVATVAREWLGRAELESLRADMARVAATLERLGRESDDGEDRIRLLTMAAGLGMWVDPEPAETLAGEAECLAADIADPAIRVALLAGAAGAQSIVEPGLARYKLGELADEAAAVTEPWIRIKASTAIAQAVVDFDPVWAMRTVYYIEPWLDHGSLTGTQVIAYLADLATVTEGVDPARALGFVDRIEQTAADEPVDDVRLLVLASAAMTVAGFAGDRAERLIDHLHVLSRRSDPAVLELLDAFATAANLWKDPARGVLLAEAETDPRRRELLLNVVRLSLVKKYRGLTA